MAKIIVTGDAVVLKSNVTLEEIKKLAKYQPDALNMMDDKGKETLYTITVAKAGNGTAGKFGISFAPETHDAEGLATVTNLIPEGVNDAKEYAAEKFAIAFNALEKMEANMATMAEAVDAAHQKMVESITVQ